MSIPNEKRKVSTSPSPFVINVLAGGSAGLIETSCTYPLDLARTRIQMIRGSNQSLTVFQAIKEVIQHEGTINLYRGLLPPLMSEVPRRALKFTANDFYKRAIMANDSHEGPTLSVPQATLAGTLTGMTETVLHNPFEVLKCRLQSKEHQHVKNTWECAQHLYRTEGFAGFYCGFEAYLWRQGLWNGVFFGSISFIREVYPFNPQPFSSNASSSITSNRDNSPSCNTTYAPSPSSTITNSNNSSSYNSNSPSSPSAPTSPVSNSINTGTSSSSPSSSRSKMLYEFMTGLLAGSFATLLNTPLDVIKTRLQIADSSIIPWTLPTLSTLFREEGLRACFRGLNARLYRSAPGSGILLVGYELVSTYLTKGS